MSRRRRLPIHAHRDSILFAVETYKTVILVGETGCGKSTQVPQFLHDAGWSAGGRIVACTQPTRLAAATVAKRVAAERGCALGKEVGYAVRFGNNCDERQTRIKYMTDGHLLREMMVDPLLRKYAVVMIDEAHERKIFTDVIFGLLRKIRAKRPELRLIIASATLQVDVFRRYFDRGLSFRGTTKILSLTRRQHALDVMYLDRPCSDYVEKAVQTTAMIHRTERPGSILVFMPGVEDVENVVRALRDMNPTASNHQWSVRRLHGSLSYGQQMRAFDRPIPGVRKIVVATNIAEASLTIPDVRYVVDSCFVKMPAYNPVSALETLVTQPISKASAIQRAGRAGRVRPGKVFRLCTERDFESTLRANTVPEMQRSSMAWVVLQLKALGIDDVLHFEFLSPPSAAALADGMETLFALGAIDTFGKLTEPLGLHMAEFPVEPRASRMLLSSYEFGCSEEAVAIAAMTSIHDDVFVRAGRSKERQREREDAIRSFGSSSGDHLTLLNVFRAYLDADRGRKWCEEHFLSIRALERAYEIRQQLVRYLRRFKPKNRPFSSCGDDEKTVLRCVLSGYFGNCARLMSNGNYRTVRGRREITVHPKAMIVQLSKVPQWIFFHDIVLTSNEFAHTVSTLNPMWLVSIAPHFYSVRQDEKTQENSRLRDANPRSTQTSPITGRKRKASAK